MRLLKWLGAFTILAIAACDQQPTEPDVHSLPAIRPRNTVAAGTVQVFTDRDAWLAAVAAEGVTSAAVDYTGLTLGRITTRSQDYAGRFRIAVDLLSTSSSFNNPGIDVIPDASCSLGTGDCTRMLFNMIDPAWQTSSFPFDQPAVDSLVFPQPVKAFAATFSQVGYAVGCGAGCPLEIGPTSIHIGGVDYDMKTIIPGGYGFVGFVVGTPTTEITFTYAKGAFSYVNDIIEVYNPEVAFGSAPPTKTPQEMIDDLGTYLDGLGLKGIIDKIDHRLDKTEKKLDRDETAKACKELGKAVKEITDSKDKKLLPSVKSQILSDLNDIMAALGC
jgi:hypothetical protein